MVPRGGFGGETVYRDSAYMCDDVIADVKSANTIIQILPTTINNLLQ